MIARFLSCALALAILSGCANVQQVLPSTTTAEPGAGYVAGHFTPFISLGFIPLLEKHAFAFVIMAEGSDTQYLMPLGAAMPVSTTERPRTIAIKLPPGTYRINGWIWYDTLTTQIIKKMPITMPVLQAPFVIEAGKVHHLGSYDLSEVHASGYGGSYLRIVQLQAKQAAIQAAFARAYPNLAGQPLHCLPCVDTGAPPAAPAQ